LFIGERERRAAQAFMSGMSWLSSFVI
jgi:hypothetical protein